MAVEQRRGRLGKLVLAGLVAGVVLAPVGWVVSDRLEQDNDFCNACHLPDGKPLHQQLRRDFDAVPPVALASVHGAKRLETREGDAAAFRCFDCHAGSGFLGRSRVKLLATKDALVYLTRRFDEPTHMEWPLEDADCTKCHADYPESEERAAGTEGWSRPFHAIAVHNTDFEMRCVDCHLVHERGGSPEAYFLKPALLREACAECHSEFAAQALPEPSPNRHASATR